MLSRSHRQTLERWRRLDERMSWWERTKAHPSLYAPTFDETMSAVIRADIAKYLGFEPDDGSIAHEPEPGHWSETAEGIPWCSECGSFDVRSFESEAGYGCESCGRPFAIIWGCIGCARIVCDDCIRTRNPNDYFAHTLEQIGRELELSRERIRGMIERALRKIARTNYLTEFGEPGIITRPVTVCACGRKYLRSTDELVYCGRCGASSASPETHIEARRVA